MAPGLLLLRLLLLGILWHPSLCFNLEPQDAKTYSFPHAGTQGREPYFGFSVALQKNQIDDSSWLIVGAPRANSSYYNEEDITEPGAIFKCNIDGDECEELWIDQTGNSVGNKNTFFEYRDLKNYGWLGGALDTQPNHDGNRQTTAVCGPRWRNQISQSYKMNGVCYWLNSALPNETAHKNIPLLSNAYYKDSLKVRGIYFRYYSMGQAGFSVHFPDDPKQMIIGAPGVLNWKGTVIRLKDNEYNFGTTSKRRRRQINGIQMFDKSLVPNPLHWRGIQDYGLMGYAVTSGKYLKEDEILYATGGPAGELTFGKVIVFSFPSRVNEALLIHQEWQGEQLGGNFGGSLTTGDINGDGLSDLIVGEPMFSTNDVPDVGRVRLILSSRGQQLQMSNTVLFGNQKLSGRFGTSLSAVGDLNDDGFEDLAVGAPYEGDGAVYIFLGSGGNIESLYSQRLTPQDFNGIQLRGFGMSFSRGIDIDNNDYPDLAIGSFLSGHASVIRSRPVAKLVSEIITDPVAIKLDDSTFKMRACVHYSGKGVPQNIDIDGIIDADLQSSRVQFDSGNNQKTFFLRLEKDTQNCIDFTMDLLNITFNHEPILLHMQYQLQDSPRLSLISQPIVDPNAASENTSFVSIVTGCEEDGDDICTTDMSILQSTFLHYQQNQMLVIGEDKRPVLRVTVVNNGEPAFQPNINIQVPAPLVLIMPSTHDCNYVNSDRTSIVCRLVNPMKKETEDTVDVAIDTGHLSDMSSVFDVNVTIASEGQETITSDNFIHKTLQLEAQANITLHGYSKDEQIGFSVDEKGKVTSNHSPRILHAFSLVKSGPTPIGRVGLAVNFPIRFKNGPDFVKIFSPTGNFLGQHIPCQISGAEFAIDSTNDQDDENVVTDSPNDLTTTESQTTTTTTQTTTPQIPDTTTPSKVEPSDEPLVKMSNVNCSSGLVECVQVTCSVLSWPSGTFSADIEIGMEFNLSILAEHLPVNIEGVFKSSAVTNILSLNENILFTGQRTKAIMTGTVLQPESGIAQKVSWWIIFLAVLGGICLLIIVAYGLYKAGFFRRKKYEQLKQQKSMRAQAEARASRIDAAEETTDEGTTADD